MICETKNAGHSTRRSVQKGWLLRPARARNRYACRPVRRSLIFLLPVVLAACRGTDAPPPELPQTSPLWPDPAAPGLGDRDVGADAARSIQPPAPASCSASRAELARAEDALVDEINRRRRAGAICGSLGYFLPTRPLAVDTRLRCAARAHSADMAERGFVGHRNPDGEDYVVRARRAGFRASYIGENLAAHLREPAVVVRGFLDSDGHCANLMDPAFRFIGVGLHEDQSAFWTVLFGLPF
ncbi:MAG: CAP domain-containing protein [Proteobacteria bacterium]|nr:CAP domain-containing protein [Pseudomonadota bacterium]